MNVFLQEIVFLATSVRFWLLIALALFLFFRYRLRRQTDESLVKTRVPFSRYFQLLAWINGVIFLMSFNAWLFSGPISGIVLDDVTDLPIIGASVSAGCYFEKTPIRLPWYMEILQMNGQSVVKGTTTSNKGNFYLNWWGYGSWKTMCGTNGFWVAAEGYEEISFPYADLDGNVIEAPTRAFSHLVIRMKKVNSK